MLFSSLPTHPRIQAPLPYVWSVVRRFDTQPKLSIVSLSCLTSPSLFSPSLPIGGETTDQKVAAATFLKNFTRRNINNSPVSKEFKDDAVLKSSPSDLPEIIIQVTNLKPKESQWIF